MSSPSSSLAQLAYTREQRAAWIPYFKEITALIFLAPLSSFNETLAEDPRVNRLEDTFMLWKTVCSNKLLAKVQIVSSRRISRIIRC